MSPSTTVSKIETIVNNGLFKDLDRWMTMLVKGNEDMPKSEYNIRFMI